MYAQPPFHFSTFTCVPLPMVPRYLLDVLALAYTFTLSAVTVPGTAFSMDGVAVGAAVGVGVVLFSSSVRVSALTAQ